MQHPLELVGRLVLLGLGADQVADDADQRHVRRVDGNQVDGLSGDAALAVGAGGLARHDPPDIPPDPPPAQLVVQQQDQEVLRLDPLQEFPLRAGVVDQRGGQVAGLELLRVGLEVRHHPDCGLPLAALRVGHVDDREVLLGDPQYGPARPDRVEQRRGRNGLVRRGPTGRCQQNEQARDSPDAHAAALSGSSSPGPV